MDTVRDFEDLLELLGRHRVRYLIIGGLAFIYHAKPRYTKDMDLWIDLLRDPASAGGPSFEEAWNDRVDGVYGRVMANWIGLDGLLEIKRRIDHPRHREDARILQRVKDRQRDD